MTDSNPDKRARHADAQRRRRRVRYIQEAHGEVHRIREMLGAAEAKLQHAVDLGVAEGLPWSEIAALVSMTKQGAHQKFGRKAGGASDAEAS